MQVQRRAQVLRSGQADSEITRHPLTIEHFSWTAQMIRKFGRLNQVFALKTVLGASIVDAFSNSQSIDIQIICRRRPVRGLRGIYV